MCGVFGIINADNAARKTYYGLYSLQHRGQEAAGIVTSTFDENRKRPVMPSHKSLGLVTDVFKNPRIFEERLLGRTAIGHNRYSTSGSSENLANVQPFLVHYRRGNLAVAHNGNLSNALELRNKLVDAGTIFQSTGDTELILHLIAQSRYPRQIDQILDALSQVQGAFSLVILTDDKLIAARDPNGFRPLSLGRLPSENGGSDAWIVASETCSFDLLGAKFVREIEPGEVLVLDLPSCQTGDFRRRMLEEPREKTGCVFEYVYFSRPDSQVFGEMVDKVRRKMGKRMAHENPVPIDSTGKRPIVISVPDSSNTAALGYVTESLKLGHECRYEIGLIRNHYVGRTFIAPGQNAREMKVRCKFNPVAGVLKDRVVVIVDDSIVRGTTSKQLVRLVREAGAREVHFRVASPPVVNPCYYGMDFPSKEELFANNKASNEEMTKWLEVDSLMYLSHEGMMDAVAEANHDQKGYCSACFTGNYPVDVNPDATKEVHEHSF